MDEELRQAIEALKGEIGESNTDLRDRLQQVEERAKEDDAKVEELRGEIDNLKQVAQEREATITEMQQRMRQEQRESDPIADRRRAVEMFGMISRQLLAHKMGTEVPPRFREEAEQVREYRESRMQRDTLVESTGAGTYFIPTVLQMEIIDSLAGLSPLLDNVEMLTGMPTKGTVPVLSGRPTLQHKRASSGTDMTQSDFSFTEMDWDTEEAYIFFPVDNWLLQLSPFNLGSFLLPRTREAFLLGLENDVLNADGTATYNSMTGLLNESTYVTRITGTSFNSITNADLNKAVTAVLNRFRGNGKWTMNKGIIDILDEISREGKTPILRERGNGDITVKGYPVLEVSAMPGQGDSGKDKGLALFGDLRVLMVVLAAQGIELATSTEVLFKRNQTCFRATGHIDIQRQPVNGLRLLKTKE